MSKRRESIDPNGYEAAAWRRRIWLALWNASAFYEECKDQDRMWKWCDLTTDVTTQATLAALDLRRAVRPNPGIYLEWARGWLAATSEDASHA